jgi:hypothetical protein
VNSAGIPRLYLAAAPTSSTSIPAIFRSDEVRRILENPPFTRQDGFNLVTYERATIDRGERLTVSSGSRKRLDLYRDGTFVAYAVFPDFLGWPRDADQFAEDPKINSIALIEFIYDFAVVYEQILDFVEPFPRSVRFLVGVRDLHIPDGRRVYLAPYGVGSLGFRVPRESREAPDPGVDLPLEVETSEAKPHFSTGAVAFQLAERLYNWFGLESTMIPYVGEQGHEIDPEAIRER